MQRLKKLMAFLLALCLIMSMPIVVSAAEELTIVSVTKSGDKTLQVKFNRPAYFESNAGHFAGLRIIDNMTNQNLQKSFRTTGNDRHLQNGGPNTMSIVTTGATTATDSSNRTYSDTWTCTLGVNVADFMSAVGVNGLYEGYLLCFCIEEKNLSTDTEYTVRAVWDVDGNYLKGTRPNKTWDDHYFPFYQTPATAVTLRSVTWDDADTLKLYFSEWVGTGRGYGFYLRAVAEDGSLIREWTTGAAHRDAERVMTSDLPSGTTRTDVEAVLAANPGSKLLFTIEEADANGTDNNTIADDGLINGIWSRIYNQSGFTFAKTNKFLKADGTRMRGTSKRAYLDIEVENTPKLISASINPVNNSQLVLTFSQPVSNFGGYTATIYPVDENLNNTNPGGAWTVQIPSYYGSAGNRLIGNILVPGTTNAQKYNDIYNYCNKQGYGTDLRFAITENTTNSLATRDSKPANGFIEHFWNASTGAYLSADTANSSKQDIALIPITNPTDTITVESITAVDDKMLEVTYSEPVVFNWYNSTAEPYSAIRVTNDIFELQKDANNNWLQWDLQRSATDDPAVYLYRLSGTTTFSSIYNRITTGSESGKGYQMTFAIEQKSYAGDMSNLVDNISSPDGTRFLVATNNETSAWQDGYYEVVAPAPTVRYATALSDSEVLLTTATPSTLTGNGSVSINGTAALSVQAIDNSGLYFLATFAAGTAGAGSSLTVAADTFTNSLQLFNKATTLTVTNGDFTGVDAGESFVADTDTTYSFMNADTGRELIVGDTDEFTLVSKGNNQYALMVDDQYVNLLGDTPTLTDREMIYLIRPAAHDRYQILYGGNAIADGDGSSDNRAHLILGIADLKAINSGWYLTKAGQTKPLRILPIGDSITFGTNPDTTAPRMGWRDDLSTKLNDSLDRFVFVGNQVTYVTTLDDATLARHEGNPGWTIKDHGSRNGIYDLVPGLVNKYDPDVVLLMIGINDMAAYGGKNSWNDTIKAEIQTNYTDLVAALAANMDSTDTIFCSTLTPMTSAHSMAGMELCFNEMFPAFIEGLSKTYSQVRLNDNYGALDGKTDVVCSDGIHLSLKGDGYIADRYAASILTRYAADGSYITEVITSDDIAEALAHAPAGSVVRPSTDQTVEHLNVPANVTLDLDGKTVTADSVLAFGTILDGTEGEGGIKIAKNVSGNNSLILPESNAMLPLYDTDFGGYRFFTVEMKQMQKAGETEDSAKFGFRLDAADAALALLQDAANADVTLKTKLVVTVGDTVYNDIPAYVFSAATVADYADRMINRPSEGYWTIVLTVRGLAGLEGDVTITSTPVLSSSTNAAVTAQSQDFVKNEA